MCVCWPWLQASGPSLTCCMLPCLCCALLLPAGIPYMQLEELAQGTAPAGEGADAAGASGSKRVPAGRLDAAERLVRDLALLLTSSSGGDGVAAAVQRLQYVAHDLPRVLSGPLLELLAAVTSEALTDADSLRKRQQQLATFLAVAGAELPQQLTTGSSAADASADSSSWLSAGQAGSQPAAEGLLELLGEQDSGEVLRHAAEHQAGARSARMADNTQVGEDEGHLYGWLANIHHDQDMQRYLQVRRGVTLCVWGGCVQTRSIWQVVMGCAGNPPSPGHILHTALRCGCCVCDQEDTPHCHQQAVGGPHVTCA